MMKQIQKFINLIKKLFIGAVKFIETKAKFITLGLAVLAVVISLYNSHQIKTQLASGVYDATTGGTVLSPIKITDEMPKDAPFLGNPKAKLTVVEFGDYQCPYCEAFFKQNFPTLKSNYIDTGKVKFVFLNFAFLGQESKDAANAAYCARDQGKFWEYHDQLYNNQQGENSGGFTEANLLKFANNIHLNADEFDKCLQSDQHQNLVDSEFDLGRKFGVSGTPAILIGKTFLRGVNSNADLTQAIDSQLK